MGWGFVVLKDEKKKKEGGNARWGLVRGLATGHCGVGGPFVISSWGRKRNVNVETRSECLYHFGSKMVVL